MKHILAWHIGWSSTSDNNFGVRSWNRFDILTTIPQQAQLAQWWGDHICHLCDLQWVFTIMLILILHTNFLQLMDISFYIFRFVTIMWIVFAIFGFSYKWDWHLNKKTYSNVIIVGFTRLIVSMGDVTKATTVIHLVTFFWHPFAPQFTFAISIFFCCFFCYVRE